MFVCDLFVAFWRLLSELLISTHPQINHGHFDQARLSVPVLLCITCSTWLRGGF
ncbi:hypothetical protein SynMITS9220_00230 [Synechococcus sp. MIT S9220]|nr:hypothetical protein SynMITS9220_00230 [Synechococcus sp. MIT S9220]